jgi:hypothetical protein
MIFLAAILMTVLALAAPAASAQIATPTLSLPPCSGAHCLLHPRGATAVRPAMSSAVKQACPAGTVFDAYKGVCRVTPGLH